MLYVVRSNNGSVQSHITLQQGLECMIVNRFLVILKANYVESACLRLPAIEFRPPNQGHSWLYFRSLCECEFLKIQHPAFLSLLAKMNWIVICNT
jgi:hypothetical protein